MFTLHSDNVRLYDVIDELILAGVVTNVMQSVTIHTNVVMGKQCVRRHQS